MRQLLKRLDDNLQHSAAATTTITTQASTNNQNIADCHQLDQSELAILGQIQCRIERLLRQHQQPDYGLIQIAESSNNNIRVADSAAPSEFLANGQANNKLVRMEKELANDPRRQYINLASGTSSITLNNIDKQANNDAQSANTHSTRQVRSSKSINWVPS